MPPTLLRLSHGTRSGVSHVPEYAFEGAPIHRDQWPAGKSCASHPTYATLADIERAAAYPAVAGARILVRDAPGSPWRRYDADAAEPTLLDLLPDAVRGQG